MKSISRLLWILFLLVSCDNSNKMPTTVPVTTIDSNQTADNKIASPISVDTIERSKLKPVQIPNDLQYVYPQKQIVRSKQTLQDIWDEADNIESNARDIEGRANALGCTNAESEAQAAISHAEDCLAENDYSDAESYLDEAQSALSDAESELAACETQAED